MCRFDLAPQGGPRRNPGNIAGRATRKAGRAGRRIMFQPYRRTPEALPANTEQVEGFDLYFKTPAVVLVYGNSQRLTADEDNHAGRLMKNLDRLGKEGVPIRAGFCGDRCLCRSSLRALNLYLQHGHGLEAFRRTHARHYPLDRYGWRDLQDLLGLRWVR